MNDNYVLCICEGNFEKAVVDILLENDLLIFNKNNLIEVHIIERSRSARKIEVNYLNPSYDKPIDIIRIIDSSKEKFILSPAYRNKVNEIKTVLSKPSIEILIIIAEKHFDKFKNDKHKNHKHSCEEYIYLHFKYKNIKSYDFVRKYFKDPKTLVNAILEYKSSTDYPTLCIADILALN